MSIEALNYDELSRRLEVHNPEIGRRMDDILERVNTRTNSAE